MYTMLMLLLSFVMTHIP